MKFVFILFTILVISLPGFSQISPAIKAGVGYVHVYDIDERTSPDIHSITGYPSISVEKPFPIEIRLKKRMSINPGLAYNFFKEKDFREKEIMGDQTEGKDFRLNHQSINGYVKVLYQAKLPGNTEAFFYAGGIGGINLITKTKGTKLIHDFSQEMPLVEVDVNENGKDFFEIFYYGAMIGFQPNARKYNFIKPSFEIAYFPGFISKTIEAEQLTYRDINTLQVSVYLGFRIK